jgi:hypothetical protein
MIWDGEKIGVTPAPLGVNLGFFLREKKKKVL